jgi:isopenicillin-N epimerase
VKPPPPSGAGDLARHWRLDPSIDFLNHGSFGACPEPVLAEQREWQLRLEREPVLFLHRELERHLDRAREALARFVAADPDDLVFVPNATHGVNAVLRSLELRPGDEVLATDQSYNACRNALDFVAARGGARVVVAPIPFPIAGPDVFLERVLAQVTARTRLALVDHVSSPTGLVFPVERLVPELARRGVDVLLDGAHAPGQLPLDVAALGATWYVANCHKWLCAPKGAAFLWARRDRQPGTRPLAISHGANSRRSDRSRFRLEFDWQGTFDPSAWLSVPEAIEFVGSLLPGGWDEVRRRNRELALRGRAALERSLSIDPPCPGSMVGSLAAVPLPESEEPPVPPLGLDPLQVKLFERHRFEVPVTSWPVPPRRLLRISAHLYNRLEQYERLAAILREELGGAPRRAD